MLEPLHERLTPLDSREILMLVPTLVAASGLLHERHDSFQGGEFNSDAFSGSLVPPEEDETLGLLRARPKVKEPFFVVSKRVTLNIMDELMCIGDTM